MPLAYLLLCHRMPHAVTELFRAIHRPNHLYLLHVDAKAGAALHETAARLAAGLPNVHVLPSRLCSWGGWSLVDTLLRGVAAALALGVDWTHLLPLSEGHVPLCPPDEAAAAARPGVSRIEASRLADLDPQARADLLHRLRARYRELPGVGMFPIAPSTPPEALLAALHHGGQWVMLAREACERLRALPPDGPAWAPFRGSLIADETAIPTMLLGTVAGAGLAIDRRPATFVAWPHVSGNDDWTFSEENFFAARAAGYLFIRKRPRDLPPRVAEALAGLYPPIALPELPAPDEAFVRGAPVKALADSLYEMLAGEFPGLVLETLSPQWVGCSPACYLRLRCPPLPARLRVVLLSEDLLTFKAVLAWDRQGQDEYAPVALGGRATWLIKARLWDLFLMREVILPEVPDAGFITPGGNVAALAGLLARVLGAGIALAPALAGPS